MLTGLPAAARLTTPDDVAGLLAEQGRALGAEQVTVYLVDHEQSSLVPLPQHGSTYGPLSIDSTLAGRCFRLLEMLRADGGRRVWTPLLDGLERLGVVQLEFPETGDRATDEQLNAFATLIAELVLVKNSYGDLFALVRRSRPMSLAAEIAWNLLPPLTFGTDRLVISSVLAPAYEVGGDTFDYAVDATSARFAVFDAMGHGLAAGWLATVAIGAYRGARRRGLDLSGTVHAVDEAIATNFPGDCFVTGLLAELDLASGALHWHSAGHPAPLLLRDGRVVKTLEMEAGLPLGMKQLGGASQFGEESLQPGDRLLVYTDGVVEARAADGEFFGLERLADLVARESTAELPVPETMRRLMHAILAHQHGELQDDATTMLVEWQGGGGRRIDPTRS